MKTFIQVILVIWFVAFTLFVLVPSYKVLSRVGVPDAAELPTMPEPPPPPKAEELRSSAPAAPVKPPEQPRTKIPDSTGTSTLPTVEARNAWVDVYTQQVTAYTQQVAAYKSQIESGKTRQVAAYSAVVTNTLVSLLSTALTAFLGYVFVKAGAELVNKYVATKRGEEPKSLKIF
ncbi:MAG TPA: hypothetical protein VF508_10215 [Pyrinomonadaceae bacterium]|jgi:hypothetical protein